MRMMTIIRRPQRRVRPWASSVTVFSSFKHLRCCWAGPGPRKSLCSRSGRCDSWALEQPKWSPRAPFPSSLAFVSLSSTQNFEILEHLRDFHDFRWSFGTILGLKIDTPLNFVRVCLKTIEKFMHNQFVDDFSKQNSEKLSAQENR